MPYYYVMIVDPGAKSRARKTSQKQVHSVSGQPEEFGFATAAEVRECLRQKYPGADVYVRLVDNTIDPKDAWVVDVETNSQVNTVTGETKPLP